MSIGQLSVHVSVLLSCSVVIILSNDHIDVLFERINDDDDDDDDSMSGWLTDHF